MPQAEATIVSLFCHVFQYYSEIVQVQFIEQVNIILQKELIESAEKHPEWKDKSIKEGDLFARVCGLKEPRGRVRVLGLGPTPQDLGTPGTRGKLSTRVLVEMQGRREAENRYNMLQGHVQQMEERMNRMELMLASQGRHNLETPSSHNGSNSRQVMNYFQLFSLHH